MRRMSLLPRAPVRHALDWGFALVLVATGCAYGAFLKSAFSPGYLYLALPPLVAFTLGVCCPMHPDTPPRLQLSVAIAATGIWGASAWLTALGRRLLFGSELSWRFLATYAGIAVAGLVVLVLFTVAGWLVAKPLRS